jgi:hypothetical protein
VQCDWHCGFAGRPRVGFAESAKFSPIMTTALAAFRSRWSAVTLVLEESQRPGAIPAATCH